MSLVLVSCNEARRKAESHEAASAIITFEPNLPPARIGICNGLHFACGSLWSIERAKPAEAVAAQVRSQGYQCDGPISATRDASLSKADMAVWNLKCKNGSYRVMLVPDMAARITKLDANSK